MGLLSLCQTLQFASKRQDSLVLKLKSDSKGQIVAKFDLGLLNIYKLVNFDRNVNGNVDDEILVCDYCVLCNPG